MEITILHENNQNSAVQPSNLLEMCKQTQTTYNKSEINATYFTLDERPQRPPNMGEKSSIGRLDDQRLLLFRS